MENSILFVEDNIELRDSAALVLRMEGYQVQVANDGQEALDILDAGFRPHLIVSDIMMPRVDGYKFFEAVRQKKHLKATPFIFLTARGSRHDITTAKSLGVDDYLVKPFDPDELLIAIQNRLQRTAEIRAHAVESLDDARRRLVQLLSHELRAPLTYVTGGFALLAERLEREHDQVANDDIQVSLELIQSGTQRLNRLAEQMVLFSEITSGLVAQHIKSSGDFWNLQYLVDDALILLAKSAKERGVRFQLVVPDEEALTVYGVRSLLVTAISEVIRNAIQYSPPGSSVILSMSHQEGFGVLTIIDQGPGIKPEDQPRIWDVLVQSEREHQEQQGVGMGLPIVKGIITSHGGEVDLCSTPNLGTQVTLRLLLAPASEQSPSSQATLKHTGFA
jgi:two-component system sensor histidine kinase/response regulator